MVGGAGYGAYTIVSAVNGGSGSASGDGAARSGPPSAAEVKETTEKFFAAWEGGRAAEAAGYTDDATGAEALLTAYREDAHIQDVTVVPGTASGTKVPFTVKGRCRTTGPPSR